MAAPARVPDLSEQDVMAGVSVATVVNLAASLGLPLTAVLGWLQISERTWARRRQAGVLDVHESDRVARLARLFRRASAVVGGPAEARDWLRTPNRALDRRTPLDHAATEVGAERVFQLLGRLEHGIVT